MEGEINLLVKIAGIHHLPASSRSCWVTPSKLLIDYFLRVTPSKRVIDYLLIAMINYSRETSGERFVLGHHVRRISGRPREGTAVEVAPSTVGRKWAHSGRHRMEKLMHSETV